MMFTNLICPNPKCRIPIRSQLTSNACPACSMTMELNEKTGIFSYEYNQLGFLKFGKKFLLNKALNNNGFISYHLLKNSSLSTIERNDVKRFSQYLYNNVVGSEVLDIGCGPAPLPGYFSKDQNFQRKLNIIGLDPIPCDHSEIPRVLGASEFLPFADASLDNVIFATSLDHVVDLNVTFTEVLRVLKPNGRLIIWMSDRSQTLSETLRSIKANFLFWLSIKIKGPQKLIRHLSTNSTVEFENYYIYPNWTVLEIPRGGVDPFHSFMESPKKIVRLLGKLGDFRLVNNETFSKTECFLCFEKKHSDSIKQ